MLAGIGNLCPSPRGSTVELDYRPIFYSIHWSDIDWVTNSNRSTSFEVNSVRRTLSYDNVTYSEISKIIGP